MKSTILAKKSSIFQHLFQKFKTFYQKKLARFYFDNILHEASSFQWSNKNFSFNRMHQRGPRTPLSRILGAKIDLMNLFLSTSLNLFWHSVDLTLIKSYISESPIYEDWPFVWKKKKSPAQIFSLTPIKQIEIFVKKTICWKN